MSMRVSSEFRRWSRWYPSAWRADRSAAMLGAYLDVADAEGREHLTPGEKAALVAGGIGARLELVAPGRVRDGVAAVMISLLGAYGLFTGVGLEWAPWFAAARRSSLERLAGAPALSGQHLLFGPFLSPFAIVAALAVAVWVLSMVGPEWLYRGALAATALVGLALTVVAQFGLLPFVFLSGLPALFAVVVAALALIGGRPRPWRSFGGAAVWLAGFFLIWWAPTGSFRPLASLFVAHAVPARMFFEIVIWPTVMSIGTMLCVLVALGLTVARRRALAAVVLLSSLPWAVAALRYSPIERVLWLPYLAGLVVAVIIGWRTRRRRAPQQQKLPGKTPTVT